MVGRKTQVILRVPVLRSDNEIKFRLNLVQQGNDVFTFFYFKGAPGSEIILNIDDNKCFHNNIFSEFVEMLVSQFIPQLFQGITDSYFICMWIFEALVFSRKHCQSQLTKLRNLSER